MAVAVGVVVAAAAAVAAVGIVAGAVAAAQQGSESCVDVSDLVATGRS